MGASGKAFYLPGTPQETQGYAQRRLEGVLSLISLLPFLI